MQSEGGLRVYLGEPWKGGWICLPPGFSDLRLGLIPATQAFFPLAHNITLSCWQQIIWNTFPVLWGSRQGVANS